MTRRRCADRRFHDVRALKSALWFGVALAALTGAAPVFAQATYYADPSGSGTTCSEAAPCQLATAQTKVRAITSSMTGDVIVNMAGGTYVLQNPWQVSATSGDSGQNGHYVIYQAQGFGTAAQQNPVLSGGRPITGWTLYDAGRNIWKAAVGGALRTRQLYVNGVRATKTTATLPGNLANTTNGYTTSDTAPRTWFNPRSVELIFDGSRSGGRDWHEGRCRLDSVAAQGSGTVLTVRQPCLANLQSLAGARIPTQVENVFESLANPGEWYLDDSSSAQTSVYYIPRSGEDLAQAEVIAPVLEQIVSGTGSSSNPIQNIQFKGLQFSYGTWLGPDSDDGYPESFVGYYPKGSTSSTVLMPANVTISYAKNVSFVRNRFTHLGAIGLSLDFADDNNLVSGNVFLDISAKAFQVVGVGEASSGNDGSNNLIRASGIEYHGSPGIYFETQTNAVVSHNDVADLTYSGILLNNSPNSSASYNLVDNYMNQLSDGGGIYVQTQDGIVANSVIDHNYIKNDHNFKERPGGGIYIDENSQNWEVHDNVLDNVRQWIYLWTPRLKFINVHDNWTNQPNFVNEASSTTFANNTTISGSNWPSGALQIIASAGLEAGFQDIKSGAPGGGGGGGANAEIDSATVGTGLNAFSYQGNWGFATNAGTGWSSGTYSYSSTANDVVSLQFVGGQVAIYGGRWPNAGRAAFAIDGGTEEIVDLFAANAVGNTLLWTSPAIASGTHTVSVRVVGTSGPGSTGTYVPIDRAVISATGTTPGGGSVNLALNQAISASSVLSGSYAETLANDGNISSGWSPTGADARPWLQVDLGTASAIQGIEFVSRQDFDQPMTRRDFEVRGSNDPNFSSYAVLGSQGSTPFAHQGTWSTSVTDPTPYRYVRLSKTVDDYLFVNELRVLGGGAPPSGGGSPTNVALGKTVEASSELSVAYAASEATDGSDAGGWSPTGTDTTPSLQIDLGQDYALSSINLITRQDFDQPETRRNFEIWASNNSDMTQGHVVLGSVGSSGIAYQGTLNLPITGAPRYRYVKVVKSQPEYFFVAEVQVLGTP